MSSFPRSAGAPLRLPAGELVRKADGFGEAIPGAAGEHDAFRARQIDLVADADVDGFDPGAGTQDGADAFRPITQGRSRSALFSQCPVRAGQNALGASDGWAIGQQADVGGNPDSSGMRQTLSVAQEHVRRAVQCAQDRQQDGSFTKRKQSGDIGKINFASNALSFEHLPVFYFPQDHGRPRISGLAFKGNIKSRNGPYRSGQGLNPDA